MNKTDETPSLDDIYVRMIPQSVSEARNTLENSIQIPLSMGERMLLRQRVEAASRERKQITYLRNKTEPEMEGVIRLLLEFYKPPHIGALADVLHGERVTLNAVLAVEDIRRKSLFFREYD